MMCDSKSTWCVYIHCWGYLRIVLAVPINAYRHIDARVPNDLLQVVIKQMHLSCEVVDTLHWGDEGTIEWIEGGLSQYKMARL